MVKQPLQQAFQRVGFLGRVLFRKNNLGVFDQLVSEHVRIEMLMIRWEYTRSFVQKERVFLKLQKGLLKHLETEEKTFYFACREIPELRRKIAESHEEHHHIRDLLVEMTQLPRDSDRLISKMQTLSQAIDHHVQREENDLFPMARKLMRENRIQQLSEELKGL